MDGFFFILEITDAINSCHYVFQQGDKFGGNLHFSKEVRKGMKGGVCGSCSCIVTGVSMPPMSRALTQIVSNTERSRHSIII